MAASGEYLVDNYLESIKQFGFIVLFANAFPLASVFCLITNLLEIRIKMNNMFYYSRRSIAEGASGIGSWVNIMEFLAMLSIPTNFAAIYFSDGGGFGSKGESPVTLWLRNHDHYWSRSNIILLIVAVEHLLFAIKIILAIAIPDVPNSVLAEEAKRVHV